MGCHVTVFAQETDIACIELPRGIIVHTHDVVRLEVVDHCLALFAGVDASSMAQLLFEPMPLGAPPLALSLGLGRQDRIPLAW
jgi:hypothetical protein